MPSIPDSGGRGWVVPLVSWHTQSMRPSVSFTCNCTTVFMHHDQALQIEREQRQNSTDTLAIYAFLKCFVCAPGTDMNLWISLLVQLNIFAFHRHPNILYGPLNCHQKGSQVCMRWVQRHENIQVLLFYTHQPLLHNCLHLRKCCTSCPSSSCQL